MIRDASASFVIDKRPGFYGDLRLDDVVRIYGRFLNDLFMIFFVNLYRRL